MRVLVVDQPAEQEETLREAMRLAGYEVAATLASPAALLQAIAEAAPDVIVISPETIKAMAQAQLRLEERKLVERAKGLLMKTQRLDEERAYRTLRRMAMDQNRRIGEVARSLLAMADLLG